MSGLLIYMVTLCFASLLLELHPVKVALTSLSRFSRLSSIAFNDFNGNVENRSTCTWMLSFLWNAKIASKCVCILYSINALAEFVKKHFSGLDV